MVPTEEEKIRYLHWRLIVGVFYRKVSHMIEKKPLGYQWSNEI